MNKNNKQKTHCIAVYGSLRRQFGNHRIIEGSKLLGEFRSKPELTMYDLKGFPALTKNGKTSILFEVYEVDEPTMQRVNNLEGCTGIANHPDNWYDIDTIETPFGNASYYYFKDAPNASVVESGNWGK